MDKEFGLVLAGGGTKGAYEVGVCKISYRDATYI
mgnify:CR=1 FL=1